MTLQEPVDREGHTIPARLLHRALVTSRDSCPRGVTFYALLLDGISGNLPLISVTHKWVLSCHAASMFSAFTARPDPLINR